MKKSYKTALEIILAFCKKEKYVNTESIITICETVLREREEATNVQSENETEMSSL